LVGFQKFPSQRFGNQTLPKVRQKYFPQIWQVKLEVLANFGNKPNRSQILGLPKFWQLKFDYQPHAPNPTHL
jgi:hypothetical protein